MTVFGLLVLVLIAIVAYFLITAFITDAKAQKITLAVVGIILLLVLLQGLVPSFNAKLW